MIAVPKIDVNTSQKGTSKFHTLIQSITEVFQQPECLKKLLDIIHGRSISIRTIDWYITNHTKRNRTRIPDSNGNIIDIWSEYKSQLKSYRKEAFEPFCRVDSKKETKRLIDFTYGENEDETFDTTIAQLNFFRWLITSGVLDYIQEHSLEIQRYLLEYTVTKKNLKIKKKQTRNPSNKTVSLEVATESWGGTDTVGVTLENQSSTRQTKIIVSFD